MLNKLISLVYGIEQDVRGCNLVVPLSYGILSSEKLPDASKKTLYTAVQIALQYDVPIVWASTNYFWDGCWEEENELKLQEVKQAGFINNPIISKYGLTNTITEAQNIRRSLMDATINPRTIVVVADRLHGRSAKLVWKQVFPESTIVIRSVNAKWNENHVIFFGRSYCRWLLINILRHIALLLFGIKLVGRLPTHPISKRGS